MKTKILSLAFGALMLAACGGGTGTNSFKFESGTYTISGQPTATVGAQNDGCGVFSSIYASQDQEVRVEVGADETTLTVYFANIGATAAADMDSTKGQGTVDNDTIAAVAENTNSAYSDTCSTKFTKTYAGTLTEDNAADVTVTWEESWNPSPSACTTADTGWATSCRSTISFKITKAAETATP